MKNRAKRSNNHALLPKKIRERVALASTDKGVLAEHMAELGFDADAAAAAVAARSVNAADDQGRARRTDAARTPGPEGRTGASVSSQTQLVKVKRLAKVAQRANNRAGRAGEADRHITTKMPRHLFAGKRKAGTNDRR
jgi:nucleolar GTP-binding protein